MSKVPGLVWNLFVSGVLVRRKDPVGRKDPDKAKLLVGRKDPVVSKD